MTSILRSSCEPAPLPFLLDDIPVLYEDEDEGDMGEANPHVICDEILHVCVSAHLVNRPEYQAFANMNLYYLDDKPHPQTGSLPYVSPDLMVVTPFQRLAEEIKSYKIGRDGPPPVLVAEILSERSAQQRDLSEKLLVYAKMGVAEYLLVDVSGKYMPEKLLLKRLQPDRSWKDERDADGGVTSQLDFRVRLEADGRLRVYHAISGQPYVRPQEAQQEAEARRRAEEILLAEVEARLRAEEYQRLASEARRRAEESQRVEAEARRRAEESQRVEAEARRLAEEKMRELQVELERLSKDRQEPS